MKSRHVVLAVVAVVAAIAVVVFAILHFAEDSGSDAIVAAPCGDRIFGHLSTLTRNGDRYVLRFDPSLMTSGETADTAAAEDGAVEPGEPVPNDNYQVDEGHRLFTYLVPMDTPVTVLTNQVPGNMAAPVTVAELAELLDGGTPVKLFEPLDTGFWIRVHVDTVCALDQQYHP